MYQLILKSLLLYAIASSSATAITPISVTLLEDVTEQASVVSLGQVIYPAMSKREGEHGTVILRVLVLASGKAVNAEVIQSSGFSRLDKSAQTAALSSEYKAGISKSGQAVNMHMNFPIVFEIK